jgi:hypothetical protein
MKPLVQRIRRSVIPLVIVESPTARDLELCTFPEFPCNIGLRISTHEGELFHLNYVRSTERRSQLQVDNPRGEDSRIEEMERYLARLNQADVAPHIQVMSKVNMQRSYMDFEVPFTQAFIAMMLRRYQHDHACAFATNAYFFNVLKAAYRRPGIPAEKLSIPKDRTQAMRLLGEAFK